MKCLIAWKILCRFNHFFVARSRSTLDFLSLYLFYCWRRKKKKDWIVTISNFNKMYHLEKTHCNQLEIVITFAYGEKRVVLHYSSGYCVCVLLLFFRIKGISNRNSIPFFVLIEFVVTHNCDQVKWLPLWLCHKMRLKRNMILPYQRTRACIPEKDLNCTI